MDEQWKEIEPEVYKGKYVISTEGEVRNTRTGQILRCAMKSALVVRLVDDDGNQKHKSLHRVLMQTFNPVSNPEDYQVIFKDGRRSNCILSNLERLPQGKRHPNLQKSLTAL